MDGFEPVVAAARQVIIDATAEHVDMRNGLKKLVAEMEALIASGQTLLNT